MFLIFFFCYLSGPHRVLSLLTHSFPTRRSSDLNEIFGGRALRCRPAGLKTTFSNCCKDKGKIVKDGMGSSIASTQTKIAIAKGVFTGAQAAYAAFQAGATASQAASAGANAIIVGIDPTSIAKIGRAHV